MIASGGSLRVTIARRDGGLDVRFDPPAKLDAGRLVGGLSAEAAAETVALVYNVCAAAQEAAVRSALGLEVGEATIGKVAAETLREHVLKLALVWPSLIGAAPDRGAPALAARALVEPDAADRLRTALYAPLQGAPRDLDELDVYIGAEQAAPARLMARLRRDWDAAWARVDMALLDVAAPVDWPTPTQAGRPVENSVAARMVRDPLLRALAARDGRTLTWRIAARLREVQLLLDRATPPVIAAHGIANAARGAMMVRGATDGAGRVTRLERLSPTDFATAPGGLLTRALESLPAEPDAPLEALTRLVLDCIDPCVASEVEFADA